MARAAQLDLPVFAPTERRAILVVDQRMNMFFGSQRNLKSVVAVNAAALIAWRVLANQKRLGAIVFNDRKIVQFYPGCSRLHTLLILQTALNQNHNLVSDVGVYSNPGMLNNALRRAIKLAAPGNALVILITDGSGCNQETLRLTTSISEQNDLLVSLVYDLQQVEFRGPARSTGQDCFNEPDIQASATSLTEKKLRAAGGQRLMMEGLFPEGIPIIPLNTRHNVARQLRRAFATPAPASFATSPPPAANIPTPEVKP